jgi:hypothetical protein
MLPTSGVHPRLKAPCRGSRRRSPAVLLGDRNVGADCDGLAAGSGHELPGEPDHVVVRVHALAVVDEAEHVSRYLLLDLADESVLVAFLVATAALEQGKQVVVWTTKDAVRLGLRRARCRASSATTVRRSNDCSSTPLWEWVGSDTTVFSYRQEPRRRRTRGGRRSPASRCSGRCRLNSSAAAAPC